MSLRVVVLISGRGSNMVSLAEAASDPQSGYKIVGVASNVPTAAGLKRAEALGLPTVSLDHKAFDTRQSFEAELEAMIAPWQPDIICLAGFMRKFSPYFVALYPGKILNIHPSLLPLFPGLHPHRQALAAGVKVHGCTVHVVNEELDAGPILSQAAVPVLSNDSEESLADRVIVAEHKLYAATLSSLAQQRLDGTKTARLDDLQAADQILISL